jgi:putative oxidoreductase
LISFTLDESTVSTGGSHASVLFHRLWLAGHRTGYQPCCRGPFFLLSGYHKLFNAERRAALVLTLRSVGLRHINVLQWFLPAAEFSGGLAVAMGLLSVPAALGLLIISIGATLTDGIKRIADWRPIDKSDWLDDVLYLPEVLYALLLLSVILAGPGPFSLDALIAGHF